MVRDFGNFAKGFVTADERGALSYFLLELGHDLFKDAYNEDVVVVLDALVEWGAARDIYKHTKHSLANLENKYEHFRKKIRRAYRVIFEKDMRTPKLAAAQKYPREIMGEQPE